jgi:SAM-dependent methyltransferase
MDLFRPGLREESFDYVFCNGVLHHTADPYGGFQVLCRLVKPHGYIAVGLYNTYARLFLEIRRLIFRLTQNRLLWLDYFMRQKTLGADKKQIWWMDQYQNPYEVKISVGEVLAWFRKNGIEYVNSIPKIRLGEGFSVGERLFQTRHPGTPVENWLCQLGWILTQEREGGFFITIGKKALAQA